MDRIVLLAEEKMDCLQELVEITKRQKDEIGELDLLKIRQSIRQKQEIMKKIDALDEEIKHLSEEPGLTKRYDTEMFNELNTGYKDAVKNLILLDNENRTNMEEEFELIKLKLKKAKEGKKLHGAYSQATTGAMLVNQCK